MRAMRCPAACALVAWRCGRVGRVAAVWRLRGWGLYVPRVGVRGVDFLFRRRAHVRKALTQRRKEPLLKAAGKK